LALAGGSLALHEGEAIDRSEASSGSAVFRTWGKKKVVTPGEKTVWKNPLVRRTKVGGL